MKKEIRNFLCNPIYMIILALSAAGAYGYAVTGYAIGMDDTAVSLYYDEGLAPYVGRWTLFVINRVLHIRITDFSPWITEFFSVLILMLSVTMWCILWKRVCEPKFVMPVWSYVFPAAVFLTSPIISEVFVFYLHNGICMGYGMTAWALYELLAGMQKGTAKKTLCRHLAVAIIALTLAVGCYESFILLYVMGAITLFGLLRVIYGKKDDGSSYTTGLAKWVIGGGVTVVLALLLRTVILFVLEKVYGLDRFSVLNVRYRKLFGDIFTVDGELSMLLKRFYVKYYVNAVTYLPIAVLVAALVAIGIVWIVAAVRGKDILLALCFPALLLLPVGMSMVEGLATRYRSAQYVPMICAFAVFLFINRLFTGCKKRVVRAICCMLLSILIFNQCADMNKWFYLDWMKYQDAKGVMDQVAYDLKKDGNIGKPIVFCGAYQVPYSISADAYVGYDSREYRLISAFTDPIDVHLKEKYHNSVHGYVSTESSIVSILAWGVTAFDGTAGQMIRFWEMHGIEGFSCEKDPNKMEEAWKIREEMDMPAYPEQGYILECSDYIIVNMAR